MKDPARARVTPAAIWRIVQLIPAGQVASYGQVADLAGFPRHARFVAQALKQAPRALHLPWHRVLGAGGRLAFAPGSEPFKEQAACLLAEGVLVQRGRVDWKRHRWQPTLDELLWAPPPEGPAD